jgi:hypothetical protein
MKLNWNIENSIWTLYAILLAGGMFSDEFSFKEIIIAFALVGVLHVFVALGKRNK